MIMISLSLSLFELITESRYSDLLLMPEVNDMTRDALG